MIMLAVLLVIGVGVVVQVLLTVQIAEAESMARALRHEYQWIQFENSELIHKIATQSSLSQVQKRAGKLGYTPATSRTFVYRNDVPAFSPAATITTPPDETAAPTILVEPGLAPPSPATPAAAVDPAGQKPWWEMAPGWLAQQFESLVPGAAGQGGADDRISSP
jgi:hypothetical protein